MTIKGKLCPVCQGGESLPFDGQEWRIDGISYRLLSCLACGSIPPPSGAATLEDLYCTFFDYRWYQDRYDAKLRDCRMRIQEYGPRLGKRVLDFGGGVGYFPRLRLNRSADGMIPAEPGESSELFLKNHKG